jgi:hypothetical protein
VRFIGPEAVAQNDLRGLGLGHCAASRCFASSIAWSTTFRRAVARARLTVGA